MEPLGKNAVLLAKNGSITDINQALCVNLFDKWREVE